jgi:hypothetical protein
VSSAAAALTVKKFYFDITTGVDAASNTVRLRDPTRRETNKQTLPSPLHGAEGFHGRFFEQGRLKSTPDWCIEE